MYFLTALEAENSKVQVPAGLVSGESSLSGSRTAASHCPHMAFSVGVWCLFHCVFKFAFIFGISPPSFLKIIFTFKLIYLFETERQIE